MNQENILQHFHDAQAILKGHFILSSGKHSDTYLQCARVLMNPKIADKLCACLADKVRNHLESTGQSIDLVVAPAMGGVVVGYEMARQLGVDGIFCERVDGTFTFRRGFTLNKNANVLVVEDVVTTGKSSIEAINCIKEHGANPIMEACLIDRSNGQANLGIDLISLTSVEVQTFDANNIPEELANIEPYAPGSRFLQKTSS